MSILEGMSDETLLRLRELSAEYPHDLAAVDAEIERRMDGRARMTDNVLCWGEL